LLRFGRTAHVLASAAGALARPGELVESTGSATSKTRSLPVAGSTP